MHKLAALGGGLYLGKDDLAAVSRGCGLRFIQRLNGDAAILRRCGTAGYVFIRSISHGSGRIIQKVGSEPANGLLGLLRLDGRFCGSGALIRDGLSRSVRRCRRNRRGSRSRHGAGLLGLHCGRSLSGDGGSDRSRCGSNARRGTVFGIINSGAAAVFILIGIGALNLRRDDGRGGHVGSLSCLDGTGCLRRYRRGGLRRCGGSGHGSRSGSGFARAHGRGVVHLFIQHALGREDHNSGAGRGGDNIPEGLRYRKAPALFNIPLPDGAAADICHDIFVQPLRERLCVLPDDLGQIGENCVHGVALRAMLHVRGKGSAF